MPKILVQVRGNVLVPLTAHGRAEIAKIAEGEHVLMEWYTGRSVRQNNFYHKILELVADGIGMDSPKLLENEIKGKLGYYDIVLDPTKGTFSRKYHSTAFDQMDGPVFKEYFDKAIDVICRDYLPGMTKQELALEIQQIITEPRR